MSMLANSKMMLGAALVCLILSAPLSMLSTGAVEGAVDDNFKHSLPIRPVLTVIVQKLKKIGQHLPVSAVIMRGT